MNYGKILLVDDEAANVQLLQRVLGKANYTRICSTSDPLAVEGLVEEFDPDIILLDLNMPRLDGFGVLQQLNRTVSAGDFLPIIVLTADATTETKLRALSSGAHDFLTKPFDNAEVVQRVGNLLRTRGLHLQLEAQKEDLEHLVTERTVELQTALKQLEATQQQVIQQERLHAFGTIASGVTHDFNNALSVIVGFSEIALQELNGQAEPHPAAEHLRTIMTAALDGAAMVTRLREFYRPGGADEPRAAVDVNALLEQAATITKPKWHAQSLAKGIAIEIATDLRGTPPVAGDAGELREALTNLIFNAVDAMPSGGTITLRTREKTADVRLEVSDTGVGMSEEVRRRCLEPFFTTKGERGTGLGLAMVYGTVERHGGTMNIVSEQGRGTTFILRLPKYAATGTHTAKTPEALASEPRSILVVDDQPVLCEILAAYLTRDAHVVETAANGAEALEKFAAGQFDLVITDHVMPGMSGSDLAARIKARSPTTPVFLLTGYADAEGEVDDELRDSAVDYVLGKPISQIELRQAITRAVTA